MEREKCFDCSVELEEDDVVYCRRQDEAGKWGAHAMCEPCWRDHVGDPDRVPHKVVNTEDKPLGEFNNVEVVRNKFKRDDTIVLSHPWVDGPLAATYLVIAAVTDNRQQILLTAGVYMGESVNGQTIISTWPEELIQKVNSPRIGQSIQIALNEAEAAWYNNRDRMESFHRTLALACMAPDIAGGWNGFHFFEGRNL